MGFKVFPFHTTLKPGCYVIILYGKTRALVDREKNDLDPDNC